MTRTLLLTGLRDLLRRPLHSGLMVLGVALGVAMVIAIELANEAARRGFSRSTEAVVGRATHQLLGGPSGLPQELLARLRREAGLRASAPVVEGGVLAVDLGRQSLRVLGVDPLSEAPFRPHLGGGDFAAPGFARFLTDPRGAIVSRALSERHHLALGSPLRLQVAERIETLTVLGIVAPTDAEAHEALEDLVLMDVGAAQRLLHLHGRLTRIDLIAGEAELRRVRPLLPAGAHLQPASEQARSAAQLTAAFQLNLTALSLLALVVGMFLIYNTVMFGVVQRRAVFGTLRALGATPGQILALVLAEAGAASALGALLGLGLGVLLGQGAVRLVTQTINDLYFVLSVREAPLTALAVARGLSLGIGAGLLAALAPAIEAARVEPVTALRASTFEARTRGLVPWVAAAGLLLCAAGGLLLANAGRALVPSFAGLFGIVLGLALMTPLATAGLMRVLTPAAGLALGTLGRLAARTVTRAAARTGVAVAALMVAVATTIGVTLMIQSFRETVGEWLELALRADVYVSAPGARSADLRLPPELRSRLRAVPGVGEVESIRLTEVQGPLGPLQLAVTDARRERNARLYRLAPGALPEAWARVQQGAVLMSEPFASRFGAPASVRLLTDRGEHDFPVAGVYYDYASERGTLLMQRAVYERFFDDRALSSLAVHLAPGAQLESVLGALRAELAGTALQVTPNASLKRTALKIFDRTFAVTEALRVLAVVVAFIGVWSALLALLAERTRELHTLQALGLTPRQLFVLVGLETGLMGLAAGLFALPTGTLLASILVSVINVRSFGWTMALRLEPGVYVQALAISVSAALLAGVYPLLRLQRQSVAAGLRQE